MKKIVAILTLCAMLLTAFPAVSAVESEAHTGIAHEWMTTRGTEYPVGAYNSVKLFEEFPATMEAWVYLPGDTYAQLGGTILGNKPQKSSPSFNFSVLESGVPQLAFVYNGGEHTFKFTNAVIPQDTWTHVAIAYGTGTDNQQVCCYINGELKGTSAVSKWYAYDAEILTLPVGLAGDRQQVNFEGFRGTLESVTAYSDARTAEEILADAQNGPDLENEDLLLHYDLSQAVYGQTVEDLGPNGYHMQYEKMWLTQAERDAIFAEDEHAYTYTMAFIPDIQISTRLYPSRLKPIYDYLIENKEAMNIQYAISLGDLTDTNTVEEWERVKTQYDRLNGLVPYALIRGNHDITRNEGQLLYDQYFSDPEGYYYNHVQENGGAFDETTQNTYLLFEVGDVEYLILNLDFGCPDDVLAWADDVLTEYSDRRAFIVTHGYLRSNGELAVAGTSGASTNYESEWPAASEWNDADDLWEKLIRKHENIDLVACGHVGVDHIIHTTQTGDNGNTVHQMLSDTQYVDRKILGAGIVTMMHFTEDGRYARVEHYSTVLDRYFRESNYAVTMDFDETSEPAEPEVPQPIQGVCEACGGTQTWQPVTADSSAEIPGGHYYLAGDTTVGAKTVAAGNTVCLDLKDYTLTANAHMTLNSGAILNIQAGEGLMRGCGSTAGDPGGTVWIKAGGEMNLYSGTLTAFTAAGRSFGNGGVLGVYGTLNIYGGTIRDGIVQVTGSNVFVDRAASFNMYGGQILGDPAGDGDCVYTRGKTLLAGDATVEKMLANPRSGSTTVEDLLTIQGAYTGRLCLNFAKVTAADMVMGISDNADLSGANIYFYGKDFRVKVEGDNLVSYLPQFADVIGNGETASYDTLDEALANLQDGQKLVLYRSVEDPVTIDKNILLDLNGRKLNSTLKAADNVTVYVMDSTTADYSIADGVYGKVLEIEGNVLPAPATESTDPYLQTFGTTYYSFHAVGLNIKSMALRPEVGGVYFKNQFAGDIMVANRVTAFGIALSVTDEPGEQTLENPAHFTRFAPEAFGAGEDATGTLLTGIIRQDLGYNTNTSRANMTIYGRAYVEVGEGQYLFGVTRQRSLKEQLVGINAKFDSLEEAQKDAAAAMYGKFRKLMSSWNLDKIQSYTANK